MVTADAAKQASAGHASPNFGHLAQRAPLLATLGVKAERFVFDEPDTALFRLRQFGEALAQEAAASVGLYPSAGEAQVELLRRLRDGGIIDREIADLFHTLRKTGNRAVHDAVGTKRDALHGLQIAWRLGTWYQKAFGDRAFKAGRFIPPPDPRQAELALTQELAALRQQLADERARAEQLELTAAREAELAAHAAAQAKEAYGGLAVALELAGETEAKAAKQAAEFEAKLAALQAERAAAPKPEIERVVQQAQEATRRFELDESETRLLIDEQLRAAGWEADSVALSYRAGARPIKGRNLAIAEWPTASGPADYVLFAGLVPIGIVEAKRRAKDVVGAVEQAKRYSRSYDFVGEPAAPGAPWGDYKIPFLFATNGRPYLRQMATKSGIWFLDARRATNHPRPLDAWRSPEGLVGLLEQDIAQADAKLAAEPADYLPLRDYQRAAVAAVERAIAEGRQDMLLAMATGTGKTRLALCLIYRLVKAGRFRRVLFLVDRTALGEQAYAAFKDVRLENLQTFEEIYDVKELGELRPDPDTRVHIATVQSMVKRLMYTGDDAEPVPVDWYDCVIVDECHRGYALDQEMSDLQVRYRSEQDYISKYRRVLDHFDAVRIGLTATPALHTTEIFGKPIYEYGYRQAVLDGYLVDHEPPIRILTKLNQEGIHWAAGQEVGAWNPSTSQIELFNAPDEIDIEVEGFNLRVRTEPFNRAVCELVAKEIDPSLPGKTMIFCATDEHADLVVVLLKQALCDVYGEVEDDAVMKITGAADKPLDKLRHFKTERLPKIAVTVDLLTTGIDVPELVNLVFIRRVRSRILYDQMLGRATRLCPEIGKEVFRIYDAVDLYAALQPYSAMKPVVTRPNLDFAQLVEELRTIADPAHQRAVVEEIVGKLQARKRRLSGPRLEAFVVAAGMEPAAVIDVLKGGDPAAAVAFFAAHPQLVAVLDDAGPSERRKLLVSDHDDELRGTERGYGSATKPEDYLAGFRRYITENATAIDALMVVTQRPRDLTRQQLKALRLALDTAGYSEVALRTAWAQVSNQEIAASIIGFIRQQALGSALVPYDQRVDRALARVLASQAWTTAQRRWLERIAKQLKAEIVVDREALDRGQFAAEGGFHRMNKVFEGKLEQVLGVLHEEVWKEAG
jgi:type I restriction enzyme, R subunit